jgi:hypothetical protein
MEAQGKGIEMKKFLLLVLLSGCTIHRWADRIEVPSNQVWDVYSELHVIKVETSRRFNRITAIPYGKPYPKYAYEWDDYEKKTCVGDIISLTDSLRSHIDYDHNWKKHKIK